MRRSRSRPEPRARALVFAIAAGRIGIGLGALFATRPGLRALGFAETTATSRALARLAGGRDIALGALTLAARDDREWLRRACLAAIAVDAGDALTLGSAGTRHDELGHAGLLGFASGAAAAAAGTWALSRLSEGSWS